MGCNGRDVPSPVGAQHLTDVMARGLSRELSQQKNVKEQAKKNQGNQEGLTALQRAERDAKIMQEKAAAKAASKAALAASGEAGAAAVAAEEAKKVAKRAQDKERRANETQIGKQNAKMGVFQPAVAGVLPPTEKGGASAPKPKLTEAEKKKKLAAAAALAAAGGAAPKKKPAAAKAAAEEETAAAEAAPAPAAAAAEPMEVDAGKPAGKSSGQKVADAAGKALASSEEVVVPERKLTEAELAKVAERAAAAAERKAALAEKEARASAEGAQQQVRAAIEAGELKGLSLPEWELLISSASSA